MLSRKKCLVLVVGLFIFMYNNAFAEVNCLEVRNADNLITHQEQNKIYVEKNIYPGWSKSNDFTVKNKCLETATAYMTFDINGNVNDVLSNILDVSILKESNIIQSAQTLNSMYGQVINLGDIEGGQVVSYEINVKFRDNAGNEYQGLASNFNIRYQLEQKLVNTIINTNDGNKKRKKKKKKKKKTVVRTILRGIASNNIVNINDDNNIDNDTSSAMQRTVNNDNEDAQKNQDKEEAGHVAGERTCHSWSWWIWFIFILIYGGVMYSIYRNVSDKNINKYNFLWYSAVLLLTLILWYFFDTCHINKWFPVVSIIVEIVLLFISFNHNYLHKIK